MPFIAIDRTTNQRVDISEITNPREVFKNGNLVCQICGQQMMIRAGLMIRHHFAHYPKRECDNSNYRIGHPETPQHDFAKKEVTRILREDLKKKVPGAIIEYEVPIPEARRIADVLVTFPMGWRIAHEIQLAKITIQDLEERTDDYNAVGIDVFWWLGKDADNVLNRDWCVQRFGFALRINIVEQPAIGDAPISPSSLA